MRLKKNEDVIDAVREHLRPGALFTLTTKLNSYRSPTATYSVLSKQKDVAGNRNAIVEGISLRKGTIAVYAGETRVPTKMKTKDVKAIAYLFVVEGRMCAIMDLHFVKPIVDLSE